MIADSTIIIDFLRNKKNAIDALSKTPVLYTTAINVFEVMTGIYFLNKKRHAEILNALLTRMIILPLDRKSSLKAAKISADLFSKGLPIEATDCLIAGIALANGVTKIITANISHFSRIQGVEVITY